MFARALRRVRRLTALIALLAIAATSCQPSAPSRPGRTSNSTRTTHAGQRAASGEVLEEEESNEPVPGGAPEPPAPNLETLRARYGTAPALSRFRGEVSYYSDSLAGNPTASGEIYQPRTFSAAHRSLPFGSVVRVVREDTQQVVFVRINDRGPFVRGRVLDLSRAAAEAIGLIGRGVTRVTGEVVEYGAKKVKKKKKKGVRKKRR